MKEGLFWGWWFSDILVLAWCRERHSGLVKSPQFRLILVKGACLDLTIVDQATRNRVIACHFFYIPDYWGFEVKPACFWARKITITTFLAGGTPVLWAGGGKRIAGKDLCVRPENFFTYLTNCTFCISANSRSPVRKGIFNRLATA